MKNVAMLFVAVALAYATTASAAEQQAPAKASISASMLANMGMGGMQQLSDEQGMQIRGEGKTRVNAWNISIIKVSDASHKKITVIQNITVKVKKKH